MPYTPYYPGSKLAGSRLLRMSDVVDLTALSRATIYRQITAGSFPVPIKIAGASRWLASEVTAFIEGRVAERAERPDHG